MSTFLDSSGRLDRGTFAVRFLLTAAVWVGLIYMMLHYVGKVWPRDYQIHEAIAFQAEEKAKNAGLLASPAEAALAAKPAETAPAAAAPAAKPTEAPVAPAAASPAPAASGPAVGSVVTTAAPANGTATAAAAAAPAAKPVSVELLPHDSRLSGFDRHAFGNVAIFYSVVISILAAGVTLNHVIKRLRDSGRHAYWSLGLLVPGVMIAATYVLHRNTFEMTPVTPLQWVWGAFMAVCALLFVGVLLVLFTKPSAPASDDDHHGHAHVH